MAERLPAVPRAGSEPENALDAIVVRGGAIEDPAHPCAALALAPVVAAEGRMRWSHGYLRTHCAASASRRFVLRSGKACSTPATLTGNSSSVLEPSTPFTVSRMR